MSTVRPISSSRSPRPPSSTPAAARAGWRSSWVGGGSTSSAPMWTSRCWTPPGVSRRSSPGCTAISPTCDLGRTFDVVVMAGNVPLFTPAGTQPALVGGVARHVAPGGVLIAGFSLGRGYSVDDYDADCAAAGLVLDSRWSTWDRGAWTPDRRLRRVGPPLRDITVIMGVPEGTPIHHRAGPVVDRSEGSPVRPDFGSAALPGSTAPACAHLIAASCDSSASVSSRPAHVPIQARSFRHDGTWRVSRSRRGRAASRSQSRIWRSSAAVRASARSRSASSTAQART